MSRSADTIVVGTFTATDTASTISTIPTGVIDTLFQVASGTAYWGDATSQPFSLTAGQSIGLAINNPTVIYWKTSSGTAVINWFVRK